MTQQVQLKKQIEFEHFLSVDLRVGTVVDVRVNERARHPAYVLTIDFGSLGTRISSAQITELYNADDLIGTNVVAVVNFAAKRVAGVKSEVLVLAAVGPDATVLLRPERGVPAGSSIL